MLEEVFDSTWLKSVWFKGYPNKKLREVSMEMSRAYS